MKNIFFALSLTLTLPLFAAEFKCSTETSGFGGWLDFNSTLKGELKKVGGFAKITNYAFFYEALDGNYVWSKADIKEAAPVYNNSYYRPRVYMNHVQFDISKGVFGMVKLLVPEAALHSRDDFSVTLIMSWIEDHAGDSVSLECSYL